MPGSLDNGSTSQFGYIRVSVFALIAGIATVTKARARDVTTRAYSPERFFRSVLFGTGAGGANFISEKKNRFIRCKSERTHHCAIWATVYMMMGSAAPRQSAGEAPNASSARLSHNISALVSCRFR